MNIWNVIFRDDRGKNAQTLADLEIRAVDRENTLKALVVKDYSEGPLKDTLHKGPDMWVFGKVVKGQEVYIKVTMGTPSNPVLCISFHIAEHKMIYPLK